MTFSDGFSGLGLVAQKDHTGDGSFFGGMKPTLVDVSMASSHNYFLFPLCDWETCGPVELELVEFSMDLNHSGPMICHLVWQTDSSLLFGSRLDDGELQLPMIYDFMIIPDRDKPRCYWLKLELFFD